MSNKTKKKKNKKPVAKFNIVKFPDSRLKQVCKEINIDQMDHKKYVKLAFKMIKSMGKSGFGLSANQVGIMERMFVAQLSHGKIESCINPRIISSSEDTNKMVEGCLSLEGEYNVVRPTSGVVEYYSLHCKKVITKELSGMYFRVFCHELDHLNGITIKDKENVNG